MATAQVQLTNEQLSDTLCSAFEGGSNYWIVSIKRVEPKEWTFTSDPDRHYAFDYPLNPGGSILITTEDEEPYRLDGEAIKRGVQSMADQYPSHLVHILEYDGDAVTGDVFLQCCLFGEVVYG